MIENFQKVGMDPTPNIFSVPISKATKAMLNTLASDNPYSTSTNNVKTSEIEIRSAPNRHITVMLETTKGARTH